MKISIIGLLHNISRELAILNRIKTASDRDIKEYLEICKDIADEFEEHDFLPSLEELIENLKELKNDNNLLDEFLQIYCLKQK